METGISVFFNMFLQSFNWQVDGSYLFWLLLITIVGALFFSFRKDQVKTKQLVKIMFIVGFWGTLYGLVLTFAAVANPNIPENQKMMMMAGGISASLLSLFFSVIGWFLVSVIEIFLGQSKAPV